MKTAATMAPMDPIVPPAPLDPVQPPNIATQTATAPPEPVRFRRFDDADAQREEIYRYAAEALRKMQPVENATHRLEIADVDYEGPFTPTKSDEKKIIMQGASLHRPLRGTVRLIDKATETPVDEQKVTLARIPHLNSRGLFIRNGVVWSVRNQARLRPGVYTRPRADGGTESHFNIKPGTGRAFRLVLEPGTGLFKMQIGQSTTRLYPLLRQLGVSDDELKEAWGEELYNKNYKAPSANDINDLKKVVSKLGSNKTEVDEDLLPQAFRDILDKARVDPETTELTLGEGIDQLSVPTLIKSTSKILKVARGEASGDNRDSQAFQSVHGAEDFLRERLQRDPSGALRKLLWRSAREGKLKSVPTGVLDKNIGSLFEGSGLALAIEDINPFEVHDQRQALTRMGHGGISSEQAVSRAARGVQASYLGIIDPVRGPESSKLGLDLRVTDAALKGSDNQLYTKVLNPKTGEPEIVSARTLSNKVVAFPGEMERDPQVKRVPAIKGDQVQYVDKNEVDYVVPDPTSMMSRATAMIPFPESVKGQRLLMGARMTQQAMPLREPESPLVQTAGAEGESLHKEMGRYVGAAYAPEQGTVVEVSPDQIKIRTARGENKIVDLYNNYPSARKTMLHNTPLVKKGDFVSPGQLLAKSNYTDDDGTAAIGRNLRVAFMAAEGGTIEDAFVISESAAKKLTSEALYKSDLDLSDVDTTEKKAYQSVYGDKFEPEQYDKLDDEGVIRVGAEVQPGDPLILGFGKKSQKPVGALTGSPISLTTDHSQTWKHNAPGVVTDVSRTRKGIKVTVKSYDMMKGADKLSGRFGNKGVISEVRPDDQMPMTKDGQPIEVIANALGIVSRTNPGALAETLLGKVARKRGKPYTVKGFDTEDVTEFALQEALKHGVIEQDPVTGRIKDTEDLVDPRDGSTIPNVFTGESYFMKLHHMAESKMGARDVGTYTTEGIPAKGGKEGSKRIAMLDAHALLSAGATNFLRDAKLIRGQRNDDYWRAVRAGEEPVAPTESFANEHFKDLLRGAGINIREKGTRSQLTPITDDEVDALATREVENSGTFNFETMKPVPGGLFDMRATGGAEGSRFAKITLPEPVPHPLFMDPIQKLLGLTGKKLNAVLAGKEEFRGETGPKAIQEALGKLDIDHEIGLAKETIRAGRKTKRDQAIKRLNFLAGLKKMELDPSQLMVTKIPVIPPKYRPITSARGIDVVHDLNFLYHDLLESRDNYQAAKETFGEAGDEYLTMLQSVGAISGTRDPISQKSAEQGVKGILRHAIGIGQSPKGAFYQRKVIGTAVDSVGRGVITADKNLDMDEVGIPKDMAFKVFRPYVIRRLRRMGLSATDALKLVRDQKPVAQKALEEEMKERPVVYNRAPALHRYAYVGAWGKLRDDDAIGMPYHTLKGIGGDFDGDQINIHVPASSEAVEDAKTKLMPSKNLFFTGTFETHLEPMQDYLAGLYLASTPDKEEPVHTFATEEEARRAFARGKINIRTPIRILER